MIFQILKEYIWSEELKSLGRMNVKDFIRERVLTFPYLVLFFISMAKKSLQITLNEFCHLSDLRKITKQGFCKARLKLSARTFILLNQKLIEEYYSDNEFSTWKGYRLIAVDGSDIQLPQKQGIKELFGTAKNQRGSGLAMSKISCAFDVLNKITLDTQIGLCKASERDLAVNHISAIEKLKHDKTKDLYIYDRGYPSLGLLFYLNSQGKDFLMRCSLSTCFSKIKGIVENGQTDAIVRLYARDAAHNQIAELKKRVPSLDKKNAYIDVRVIIIPLKTGEKELLITSLIDQSLYSKEEIGFLYNLRWRAEENYKFHKLTMELENFSGQSKLAIEQDIYSLVFTANMASLFMQEAQNEVEEEHQEKQFKHNYRVNKRIALGTLKDKLIESLLEPDFDMEKFCTDVKAEFKQNLCPVRPDRQYKRHKKTRLKYSCTARRCI